MYICYMDEDKVYSKINLLLGPPGSGKTYAGEQFARERGADLIYYLCHAWTSAEELFAGVDVVAAVAGEADKVRQPGVLALAAEATRKGEVVLIIDELDKAPERVEALLLDFLQSGRVPVRPGVHIQADLSRLWVFITSNQMRDHSGPLMRRCKRHFFRAMRAEEIAQILSAQGYDYNKTLALARFAHWVAQLEGNEEGISLSEIRNALDEMEGVSEFAEFVDVVAGWCVRTAEGANKVRTHGKTAELWGKLKS